MNSLFWNDLYIFTAVLIRICKMGIHNIPIISYYGEFIRIMIVYITCYIY